MRGEENPSEKHVNETLHKQFADSAKKKKNKKKDRKGKGKGESSTSNDPVIREGAAVFIASSTRSYCNHEALLVESFSSVPDS